MLSIVIPVFNKWELTKACLQSLAKHRQGLPLEVLVVDNASTDATALEASSWGQVCFGADFRYVRQDTNLNFSGACNVGARLSQGEYLLFLNNDTLLTSSWAKPWQDLQDNKLGAISPLLLYPQFGEFHNLVQHLGICFSPMLKLGHLYEFFPSTHRVVQKSRNWQAITAAAMFISKQLFLELGGFAVDFINGFEDVELCQRIIQAGYSLAVQPQAIIYHWAGQSLGRHSFAAHNEQVLRAKAKDFFVADKAALLAQDGYTLQLSAWGSFDPTLDFNLATDLTQLAQRFSDTADYAEQLQLLLHQEPYWMEGYQLLLAANPQRALAYLDLATGFWHNPSILLPLAQLAKQLQKNELCAACKQALQPFFQGTESRIRRLRHLRAYFRSSQPEFSQQASVLLREASEFEVNIYKPNWDIYQAL